MKNIKRKNFNNQKMVDRVTPSGMAKVIVTYVDGTKEEMAVNTAKQVIREVKS